MGSRSRDGYHQKSSSVYLDPTAYHHAMKPQLLSYLCDPVDKSALELVDPIYDNAGNIVSGALMSGSGRIYVIRSGIPRFVTNSNQKAVSSFGDEWNYFSFYMFKSNWLNHTIKNTFGNALIFSGKVVVDAGAGSGMQSLWISQARAKHVISLELSHSVDGIMKKNLKDCDNIDIVQCSIDSPPIKDGAISGLVICHNVIQHTRSVEGTARALWRIVAPGGEFVFNCYAKNDTSRIWMMRFKFYLALRAILSRRSFSFLLNYSRMMSLLRFFPLLGWVLEKSIMMIRGDVPKGPHYLKRCYLAGVLNTFDWYGSHKYQHHKTRKEIETLVAELQSDPTKILNIERYFSRPPSIGCALRLLKTKNKSSSIWRR
jgi:SAM-dependent methyltransferase/uncharacterized protein YbaR (Trm112 family)